MLNDLLEKVLSGRKITRDEAVFIVKMNAADSPYLFGAAERIRSSFRKNFIDLCAIINAKSGACSEDCSYCAQSSRFKTASAVYPLLSKTAVLDKAREAKNNRVKRFCIVTSGRKVNKSELKKIAGMTASIRDMGLLPCSTLGLLDRDELEYLKENGLERYHHNLETSERFFPSICTTHSYRDKIKTIEAAKAAGLSVCSGGIFGLGENWDDRLDMAFEIQKLGVDSVPINYLMPVKGTGLETRKALGPFEALKIISLYRFVMPEKEIRVCGGRIQALGDKHGMIFKAGADSVLTGNYLTTTGRTFDDDLKLIDELGLNVSERSC
ncbi:MAG: biotin synthase BioB [Nitrospirae bacterium]|nr:MAG: biotin synthase BioB [Nitrospirota bacterium]